jgi:glyoxylase-like metal-dependent hydrolase (beta-lactamase superfamily II)
LASHPPHLSAGNAGPFTLDGTRSYRIGRRSAVVLDPGPDVEHHVRALASWLSDADEVRVVLTHGHHDHAGGAPRLAQALRVPVMGPAGVAQVEVPLDDGARIPTDEGTLVAVPTPGHARHHLAFLWDERQALFVGDLMLGRGDTTWVGEYPGCVADYLESLATVRRLAPQVIYPAHGPPIDEVQAALDRYQDHRMARIRQVEEALRDHPGASGDDLVARVYGTALPSAVHTAARMSLEAMNDYLRRGATGG